ncbi:glycosyltransferase family 8 protein [Pontiella sp.]|uniref:glycosyltransferase family 8 protein n=1 Tax=Pontiella sp. TaxID=2837462 RepID=UPI0035634698
MIDSPIKVCLAADRKYLQHLVVTMASVLIHANASDHIEFLILSDGSLTVDHFSKVEKLGNCEIQIVRADQLVREHMVIAPNPQWPVAVYYRLLLPYLCEHDARVIYLDCDIIVRASLAPLWCMVMDKSFAGVADTGFDHQNRLARRGVECDGDYFNSGVAVLNLERIRVRGYEGLLRDVERKLPNPEFPDQDWLNLMFEGDKQLLLPEWNAMSHLFFSENKSMAPYTGQEVESARTNPKIYHFTNIKPWTMTYNEHPYWFEYWEVLKYTPFAWRYPAGVFKKMFLSKNDTVLFRHIRPAVKRVIGWKR